MLNFHILTLFPSMFREVFSESILKRAQEKSLVNINVYDLRDWGLGKRKQVDDTPYGGGAGMVLRVDVIDSALQSLKLKVKSEKFKVILLTPQGKLFNQKKARTLTKYSDLILICGHYEGFDERIRNLADEEISIGDYILTGGEIPAMVVVDAVTRLISGVLGKQESLKAESFTNQPTCLEQRREINQSTKQLLEYPQYTKPDVYKNKVVPNILLSGNHQKIKEWREKEAIKKTKQRRPDLLKS